MTVAIQTNEWLTHWLAGRLAGKRFPLSGTLELTWRCNFRCVHCYLRGQPASAPELSTDVMVRLLDDMAAAGCLGLVLTGGEPLLRTDFQRIYQHATRCGFVLSLLTNASFVDAALADDLAQRPPRCIEVSLYGSDETSYGLITGDNDNYARVMRGLDFLQSRGLPVGLKTMLLAPLAPFVPAMRQLARERGLSLRVDPGIDPTLLGDADPASLRVEPELAARVELDDPDRCRKLGSYDETVCRKAGAGTHICAAGSTSFHVDPAGRLMPCLYLRATAVAVAADGFAGAFERLGAVAPAGSVGAAACEDCDVAHLCSYCPGLEHLGEPVAALRDGYHCRLARARAQCVRAKQPRVPAGRTMRAA